MTRVDFVVTADESLAIYVTPTGIAISDAGNYTNVFSLIPGYFHVRYLLTK